MSIQMYFLGILFHDNSKYILEKQILYYYDEKAGKAENDD